MRARSAALQLLGWIALAVGGAVGARADDGDAASLASAVRRCATIAADAQRLACFDQAVPHPAKEPAGVAPARDEFGLSPAQRPQPAPIESLSARVTAFGRSAARRTTVALDNGQLWELDQEDALLAIGDAVTIRHGALTSFLLDTPQHRTHHVRRLR